MRANRVVVMEPRASPRCSAAIEPPAHCLPVQQFFVAGRRLNRMPQGVAEVQNHPQAGFLFILRHYLCLNGD